MTFTDLAAFLHRVLGDTVDAAPHHGEEDVDDELAQLLLAPLDIPQRGVRRPDQVILAAAVDDFDVGDVIGGGFCGRRARRLRPGDGHVLRAGRRRLDRRACGQVLIGVVERLKRGQMVVEHSSLNQDLV